MFQIKLIMTDRAVRERGCEEVDVRQVGWKEGAPWGWKPSHSGVPEAPGPCLLIF